MSLRRKIRKLCKSPIHFFLDSPIAKRLSKNKQRKLRKLAERPDRFITDSIMFSFVSKLLFRKFKGVSLKEYHRLVKIYYEIKQSRLFDGEYYKTQVEGIGGMDPLAHFVSEGFKKGLSPNAFFDTTIYMSLHPELKNSGILPYIHYLRSQNKVAIEKKRRRSKEKLLERCVVYTCITGSYDELKQPTIVSENCDYICFTDQEIQDPGIWQLWPISYYNVDPTRSARFLKSHPHVLFPKYDVSFWVDGHIQITGDITKFIDELQPYAKIATFIHPHRDCIYDELNYCLTKKFENDHYLITQTERYMREGYPRKNGLVETGVMFRRHNDKIIIKFMNAWWGEIQRHSKRDQLSFNYIAHKYNIRLHYLAGKNISVRNHPRFKFYLHGNESIYERPYLKAKKPKKRPFPFLDADNIFIGATSWDYSNYELYSIKNVDIVVCVHNALDDVKKCLISLMQSIGKNHQIILVDDGSNNETKEYLQNCEKEFTNTLLLRNDESVGYCRAANKGMKASTAEYIVLLNSDTIVPKLWLLKLIECAESGSDIGIVGPLSNAASWQTVPNLANLKVGTDLPKGFSVEHMDYFAGITASPIFPRVGLINGFCYLIKKEVIKKIGYFDEERFPQGYGEEDDFTLRAANAGYSSAVATHTFVYHAKSKSYTPEKRIEIASTSGKVLRNKHSAIRVENLVNSSRRHPILARQRKAMQLILEKMIDKYHLRCILIFNNESSDQHYRCSTNLAYGLNKSSVHLDLAILEGNIKKIRCGSVNIISYSDEKNLAKKLIDYDLYIITSIKQVDLLKKLKLANENSLAGILLQSKLNIEENATEFCKALDNIRSIGGLIFTYYVSNIITIKEEYKKHCSYLPFDATKSLASQALFLTIFVNGNIWLHPTREPLDSKQSRINKSIQSSFGTSLFIAGPLNTNNTDGHYVKLRFEQHDKFNPEVPVYDLSPRDLENNWRIIDTFRQNPRIKPKKILWFIPYFDHIYRGGAYTIFAIANDFSIHWSAHNIFVMYGKMNTTLKVIKNELRKSFPKLIFEVFPLDFNTSVSILPESDAAFCTLWTSAYLLARYNKCRAKYYLVQDYEPLFYPAGATSSLISQTYHLGFNAICSTPGVAKRYACHDKWVNYYIPGVDQKKYNPSTKLADQSTLSVVFYSRPKKQRNCFRLGIEALNRVKDHFDDKINIICVGEEFCLKDFNVHDRFINLGLLGSFKEVADLYCSSDVGLVFMSTPHPSYQPFEYMASGCATVTNYNPDNLWLFKNNYNCFLAVPTVTCVADRIIEALENTTLRKQVIQGGFETIKKLEWGRAFSDIRNFVKNPKQLDEEISEDPLSLNSASKN